MKNSNLKLNVRYEVHNNVKSNIFDDFGALFSLSRIHHSNFFYESKTFERLRPHCINQLFVLFDLVGVPCWALVGSMNFWHDL